MPVIEKTKEEKSAVGILPVKLIKLSEAVFFTVLDFSKTNAIVLISVLLVWAKTMYFNYEARIVAYFPYILRTMIVSGLIALVLFSPAYFLKKGIKKYYCLLLNLFFSVVFIMDIVYLRYFNALPSVGILNTLGQTADVMPAVRELFRYTDLLILTDVVLLFAFYNKADKFISKFHFKFKPKLKEYQVGLIATLAAISLLISAFGVDYYFDGYFAKAINNTLDNKVVAENYGVIGAHFFDIYRNVEQDLRRLSPKETSEVVDKINKVKYQQTANALTGKYANKNVIMIQVESLQAFVINKNIEDQEITPNLNKLLKDSHYFDNNYFEIGGGGTSDADFSSNTSLFPLQTESAFVKFGKADYTSLPKELKKVGYSANAYHGYNRSFWNREMAFSSLGYDKFVASESYPKDDKVGMGVNDSSFFSETEEYIKAQKKPSFSYLISLTSHTPFYLPSKYWSLQLKSENYPVISRDYLGSIHYADSNLGKFMEQLKKDDLYDDSIIVLYGDHPAGIAPFNYGGITYNDSIDDKKTPLFIKLPGQRSSIIHEEVTNNLDIMPTILNLVGAKTNAPMFGRDLFSGSTPFYSAVTRLISADSVFMGDLRYYMKGTSSPVCEKEDNEGAYKKVDISLCKDLVNSGNEPKALSDKLIRYNLFKHFN